MAAPITHIVLAKKIFKMYFSDMDFKEFIIGTSFPDIRYLGVIDREITHPTTTTIYDCHRPSSFESGMRFHILVDQIHEKYVKQHGLYAAAGNSRYATQGTKFFEDQVLHHHETNWQEIAGYFDTVLDEEVDYGIEPTVLSKWHQMLKKYIVTKPEVEQIVAIAHALGLGEQGASDILAVNKTLWSEPSAIHVVEAMYANFEDLLKN